MIYTTEAAPKLGKIKLFANPTLNDQILTWLPCMPLPFTIYSLPRLFCNFLLIVDYITFHRLGPLGRFGLVAAMSICLSVPFSCNFFKVLKSKGLRYEMWLFINLNT